jgi:two-component system, OmpR family, sensor histidine kinase QseC
VDTRWSRRLKVYLGRHLFSIRRFLIIGLLSILTVAIGTIASLNYWQIVKQNQRIFQMQLITSSQILDSLINIQISEKKSIELSSLLNKSAKETIAKFIEQKESQPQNLFLKYKDQMIFQVWDTHSNKMLMKSSTSPEKEISVNDDGFKMIKIKNNTWYAYSHTNVKKQIKIIFAINENFHHKINADIFFHDLTILFIVYLIIGGVIILIVQHGLSPLLRVTEEVATRDANNLASLNIRGIPIEVRPLVRELNGLFARVRSSMDREKGFIGDAAHELKTPLAALKTQVQVAIRERNDLQRTEILKNIIIGTNRCTHVIEQLLILSHIEPKTVLSAQDGEVFTLFKVAYDLMAEIAYNAIEKDIDLGLSCGKMDEKTQLPIDKFEMKGNSIMISILLRNLIDNAIRYTPKGGKVNVVISRLENKVILDVIDTGPGIPEDLRERIFDRFYRKLGNKESGTGLGLSIVRQILRLHEADIKILVPENKIGTQMQVSFNGYFKPSDKKDINNL